MINGMVKMVFSLNNLSIKTNYLLFCSVSCGLFLLNYMEYWMGEGLTDVVTQVNAYIKDIPMS